MTLLQHKSSFIFRFWRKSRTKRLPGDLSGNLLVTLGLSDSFVARCEIWDRSPNPLGTLGLSECSRCDAVLMLIIKEPLHGDLEKEVFYRELAQRSCHRNLFQRSCTETPYRDLVQRSRPEGSYRDLTKRAFYRELGQRSLQEILPRDLIGNLYNLVQRSCHVSFSRDLARRSCQEASNRDLAGRCFLESLYRDLAKRPLRACTEILLWDFLQRSSVEIFSRHLVHKGILHSSFYTEPVQEILHFTKGTCRI